MSNSTDTNFEDSYVKTDGMLDFVVYWPEPTHVGFPELVPPIVPAKRSDAPRICATPLAVCLDGSAGVSGFVIAGLPLTAAAAFPDAIHNALETSKAKPPRSVGDPAFGGSNLGEFL